MSTCSSWATVEQANTKFSRRYAATGVGMGVCARHEFVLPTSVADLQRGERYANMDWVFFSLLQHISPLLWLIVSYDIVCQWTKKLQERVKSLAPHIRINVVFALLRFVIPKLHILGHVFRCRLLFSLLLLRGGAQTDGEGIERPWSMIGAVRGRADPGLAPTNWMTIGHSGIGGRFSVSLFFFVVGWTELESSYRSRKSLEGDGARVGEEDNSKPNPYEASVNGTSPITQVEAQLIFVLGLSERAVREQFEQEESAQETMGSRRIHDVGPTEFIISLLAVEDEQWVSYFNVKCSSSRISRRPR
ncbi:CxC2 domain-containing protein [Mycena kentingensis (nom. inval.)]|nr:CxC2 domain-containing protein [Mycena kentingensis (nom. inval.)]